jgi:hypothetical protein
MVIKSADNRTEDLAELTALLTDPGLSATQKKRIQQEIKNLEKGAWGEKQAAYYLDFHFDKYKNTIVLHDLQLVLSNGRSAQIDHLIINRFLDIYILESKNWNQLTVDEAGACTIWDGRIVGVASPLEQARRHAEVLKRTFEVDPQLRVLAPRQNISCKVLLGSGCHLEAVHHREFFIKADAFHSIWEKEIENESMLNDVLALSRMVKRDNLIKVGTILSELHNPGRRDWRAKFGIPPTSSPEQPLPNKVVLSIAGLSEYVPRWGDDWFVLQGKPTEETKKMIKTAGYRAKQEQGEWIWRLKI